MRTPNTSPGPPATGRPRGFAVWSRSSCGGVGIDTNTDALALAPAGCRLQGQTETMVRTLILARVLHVSPSLRREADDGEGVVTRSEL
jgi:hypothetical protein